MGSRWSDNCGDSKPLLEDRLQRPARGAKGDPENADLRMLQAF